MERLLIVDDSEPLHQIYRVTLKRYGCEVITALKREEGMRKLAENQDADLLLVDMNMPTSRMSCLEFVKKVKEHTNIPVVIVTTKGKDYPEEAMALTDGNLIKPFISREIHTLVEKLFPHAVSA